MRRPYVVVPCIFALSLTAAGIADAGTDSSEAFSTSAGPAGTQVPDPALSHIGRIVLSPDGSLATTITVADASGPIGGAAVDLVFAPGADALLCWCLGQAHPVVSGVTDGSGSVSFFLQGGGCLDPGRLGYDPVEVFADGISLGTGGVVSPDAVAADGLLPTDPGYAVCSPCEAGLSDASFHANALLQALAEPCSDFTEPVGDPVGLADAVILAPFMRSGTSCASGDPPCTAGGSQPNAVIALHDQAMASKGPCSVSNPNAQGIACSDYDVDQRPILSERNVYLVVAGGDPGSGISGVSCGIATTGGTTIYGWTPCAGWEWPGPGWPSGGGNRLAWSSDVNCQTQVIGTDGVHAVAGAFYVYSYYDGTLEVTPNGAAGGELTVVDCSLNETDVSASGGRIGYGTASGFNPCGITAVEQVPGAVAGYALYAGSPNPFRGRTAIRFDLAESGEVSLDVFDSAGRRVRRLAGPASMDRGRYEVPWDGRDDQGTTVASGVYYVRLQAAGFSRSQRVVLMR